MLTMYAACLLVLAPQQPASYILCGSATSVTTATGRTIHLPSEQVTSRNTGWAGGLPRTQLAYTSSTPMLSKGLPMEQVQVIQ